MSVFDDIPSWPAGHRVTGAEAAKVMALLSATATNGGLWSEMFFYKASDQLYSAQTTLQNDVDFIVPLQSNAVYAFNGLFWFVTNATALFKQAWSMPSGGGGGLLMDSYPTSVTTSPGTIDLAQHGVTSSLAIGTNGAISGYALHGTFTTAGTAGSAQFQHAQSVSNGSGGATTGMKTGSWLSVKRVS